MTLVTIPTNDEILPWRMFRTRPLLCRFPTAAEMRIAQLAWAIRDAPAEVERLLAEFDATLTMREARR